MRPSATARTSTNTSTDAHRRRRPAKRSARRGINPWVPNQHGAWAMLIVPILVGFITGITTSPDLGNPVRWLLWLAIMTAWVLGYFTFFAFGLWFKTSSPARKKTYATPLVTYGAITAVAALSALVIMPSLLWWAIAFLPLVTIALVEIYRRRPRSVASGISTTLASSLLYPVMVSAGGSVPLPQFFSDAQPDIWTATAMIALYFTGTIFYVKSIIREKGNARFYRVSMGYHWLALALALVMSAYSLTRTGYQWMPALGLIVMTLSLARAITVPPQAAANPKKWTPKFAGMKEMPYVLLLTLGCGLTLVA
ncbi:hypothetical protein GC425_06770 [Corynebacterium sp. zg254]|uniref:YwiC-like family protein n=1 Tax=Corynebacterium zhongnanshanii TaxID=2768834 RepID=A0ABQ6VE31_9CORY|nr:MULTISPECIES: YwiC-like family protein [Corynebacterium]KAB3520937.1 YwiC-like family protein [Corynebacterium zhongnanshanii]MCR5914567.1 hypothetical protein [Corynebacterium sp. zg254]